MTLSLRHPFGWVLLVLSIASFIYLLGPLVVIIIASFGDTGYIAFPPQGLSLRWYRAALANPRYVEGFLTSVKIAGIVTIVSCILGSAAAFALTRYQFRGRGALEALFLSPLILPGLVLAVALTIFFSRVPLASGTDRLILAHLVICVPCVIRVMIPVLQRFDRSIEEAAQNLGASPLLTFVLVTVPALRPGFFAAAALAFILSFDEVEMAVFLASPRNPPLTVVLYGQSQLAFDPSLAAVSALLILVVFVGMLIYEALRMTSRFRT
jgi:putative spermidine/putrescine transport system permease protein